LSLDQERLLDELSFRREPRDVCDRSAVGQPAIV
jgi:hypothetical protein